MVVEEKGKKDADEGETEGKEGAKVSDSRRRRRGRRRRRRRSNPSLREGNCSKFEGERFSFSHPFLSGQRPSSLPSPRRVKPGRKKEGSPSGHFQKGFKNSFLSSCFSTIFSKRTKKKREGSESREVTFLSLSFSLPLFSFLFSLSLSLFPSYSPSLSLSFLLILPFSSFLLLSSFFAHSPPDHHRSLSSIFCNYL